MLDRREGTYLIVALATEDGVHLGLVLGREREELGRDERGLGLASRLELGEGLKVAAQDGGGVEQVELVARRLDRGARGQEAEELGGEADLGLAGSLVGSTGVLLLLLHLEHVGDLGSSGQRALELLTKDVGDDPGVERLGGHRDLHLHTRSRCDGQSTEERAVGIAVAAGLAASRRDLDVAVEDRRRWVPADGRSKLVVKQHARGSARRDEATLPFERRKKKESSRCEGCESCEKELRRSSSRFQSSDGSAKQDPEDRVGVGEEEEAKAVVTRFQRKGADTKMQGFDMKAPRSEEGMEWKGDGVVARPVGANEEASYDEKLGAGAAQGPDCFEQKQQQQQPPAALRSPTNTLFLVAAPLNPSAQRRVPSVRQRSRRVSDRRGSGGSLVLLSLVKSGRATLIDKKVGGSAVKAGGDGPFGRSPGSASYEAPRSLKPSSVQLPASERPLPTRHIFSALPPACLDGSRILASRPGPIRAIRRQMAGDGLMRLWPCRHLHRFRDGGGSVRSTACRHFCEAAAAPAASVDMPTLSEPLDALAVISLMLLFAHQAATLAPFVS
ncbi:hypothetical protein L1887_48762 [Cichorium endivia]|nr:hypothetical protein L1887_48762 [Cichorium endivia]